jgi:hypothetical protein
LSTKIASLYAEIGADTSKLESSLSKSKSGLTDLKQGIGGSIEALTGMSLAGVGAAGAMVGLASGLKKSIDMAIEAEQIQADLNATLKSTNEAAGLSADEINRMASKMSNLTGIEDDAIVKSQAMLLTFTRIGKEVFPQATEAMLNMSTKFGSLEAASVQLGKALNDPIAGVAALRKVGVQLSDDQETLIKKFMAVNDISSAQKVILKELETEFGGLAAAMGETTQGKINRFNNSIGNLGETLGGIFLPAIGFAADALNELLTASDKMAAKFEDTEKAVRAAAPTYEDYVLKTISANLAIKGTTKSAEQLRAEFERSPRSIDDVAKGLGLVARGAFDAEKALDGTRQAAIDAGGTLDEFSSSVGASSLVTADFKKIMDANAKTQKEAGTVAEGLTGKYKSLTQEMIYNTLAAGMTEEGALKLGIAMGILDPMTIAARDAVDSLNSKYVPGARDAQGYANQVEALAAAIRKLQDKSVTITTYYKTNGAPSDNITDPRENYSPTTPESLIQKKIADEAAARRAREELERIRREGGYGPSGSNSGGGSTTININGWQGDAQSLAEEIKRQEELKKLMNP